MDDPDVILRVDGDADRLPENPVIRQRLRPEGIDFEARRHGRVGEGRRMPFERDAPGAERDQQPDDRDGLSH